MRNWKKERPLYWGILILLVLLIGCVTISMGLRAMESAKAKAAATESVAENPVVKTIVLDAGHGGFDGGATSAAGMAEKDLNLAIALSLRDMLQVSGLPVVMVRETDIAVNDPDCKTIRQKKTSDIKNRLELIEKTKDCLALSIHQNHYPQSTSHGAQMFYGKKEESSQALAELLQKSVVAKLQPENNRKIKPITKSVYLVDRATKPIVLVECGFLSNPIDAQNLSQKAYQDKMAFALYAGLLEWFGSYQKE